MKSESFRYLHETFPELRPMLDAVGDVPLPAPSGETVEDAIVNIVIGQMLSSKAAGAIRGRVLSACERERCRAWELGDDALRSAGLSGRKIRTIREFVAGMEQRPDEVRGWREMDYESLRRSVSSFWGLSDWTAAILAIFHFGHRDVFPLSDGSIVRGVGYIESRMLAGMRFDHSRASPCRTHLSMIIWASLDTGFWKSFPEVEKAA